MEEKGYSLFSPGEGIYIQTASESAFNLVSMCSRVKRDRVDLLPCSISFSITHTPFGSFFVLPKPLPSSRPRWRTLDQDTLARQNTPALKATFNLLCTLVCKQSPRLGSEIC